jgi:hypothetical protein
MAVWHSDKTEIMNSGRPAQDGDFCLGVWESLGGVQVQLPFAGVHRWLGSGHVIP